MHILLMPSGYVTLDHPSLGAKYRLHVRAYRQYGWHVGVIAPQQRTGTRLQRSLLGRPWADFDEDHGTPIYRDYAWNLLGRLRPRLRPSLVSRARFATRLVSRYVKRHGRPHLIHAHGARFSGLVAAVAKEKFGIPYVLTEHTSTLPRGLARAEEIPLIRRAFKAADARLPVSPQLGWALEAILGDDARPWTPLPNMVDGEYFLPASGERSDETKTGFTLLNIGRMDEVKAQDDLLRAFAERFKGDPNSRLRLGGDGQLREQLESLTASLGIDSQVDFLGSLSRESVLAEMQRAGAYVLTSHYETFAIPLIEALACGKPVVATACGGPESIVNDRNGILVPTNDIEALAEAMDRIRMQIDEYDPSALRQECLSRYGTTAVVEQLARIYEDVVNSKARDS